MRAKRRWRRRLLPILALVALMLVWVGLSFRSLDQARSHAQSGANQLELLQTGLDSTNTDFRQLAATLDEAGDEFRKARRAVQRPLVRANYAVPWVRTQVSSIAALAAGADELTAALATLARAGDQIQEDLRSGKTSTAAASTAATDALTQALPAFDRGLGPRRHLLPQLAAAHSRFAQERQKLRSAVSNALIVTSGLIRFFGGQRFLVLIANPSEMRVGQGAILRLATLTFDDNGHAVLANAETLGFTLPLGGGRFTDDDLARNWGFLYPNQYWQGLAMTPRFPAVAKQAMVMYANEDPAPIDGVLLLDQVALAGLLTVGGPINQQGTTISADNAAEFFGNGQYRMFDTNQAARKDFMANATAAIFARLGEQPRNPLSLVQALRPAAESGHIKAWSSDAVVQAAWHTLGIDGDVGADDVQIALSNHQVNKLDYFIDINAKLTAEPSTADRTEVTLTLTIANNLPAGQPSYVTGADLIDRPAGVYYGFLVVELPGATAGVAIDELAPLGSTPSLIDQQRIFTERFVDATIVNAADGASRQVAVSIALSPGETLVRTVRFTVTDDVGERLRVVPSGRWPQIRWSNPAITDARPSPAHLVIGR